MSVTAKESPPGDLPALEISYHDEPEVLAKAEAEDFSLHAVPNSWRSGRGSISMAWFALMSAMFWVVVGSTVALAVGTVQTLIGMGLAVLSYGMINDVASRFAARSGTSVALFSRALFGQVGATFAALLFGITITWYAVAEGSIVGLALYDYFGGLSQNMWYLVVVLYSAPLVLKGVRTWLDKINAVLLPLYGLGMIAIVIWATAKYGMGSGWLSFKPEGGNATGVPGWLFAFTVYMGVWVVVMMTWDFARFGKKKDAVFNGRISFGIPFYLVTVLINGVVGIFIAQTIPIAGDLSEATAVLGIIALAGPVGMLLVWASQTRINTANFYLSSSNMQSFFQRAFKLELPRMFWLVVMSVVIFLAMLTDALSYIVDMLQYQGVFIVAWVSVTMVHIAWTKINKVAPESLEFRPGRVPLVNPGGTAAWLVASAVGTIMVAVGGGVAGILAPPVTCVLASGIYAGALMLARRSWFVMDRPNDPRAEVEDTWEARIRCHVCGFAYIAHEMDRDPSANNQPICLSCAADSSSFLKAARAEAKAYALSGGSHVDPESGTTPGDAHG